MLPDDEEEDLLLEDDLLLDDDLLDDDVSVDLLEEDDDLVPEEDVSADFPDEDDDLVPDDVSFDLVLEDVSVDLVPDDVSFDLVLEDVSVVFVPVPAVVPVDDPDEGLDVLEDELAAEDLFTVPDLVLKEPLDTLVFGFTLLPGTCLFSKDPAE